MHFCHLIVFVFAFPAGHHCSTKRIWPRDLKNQYLCFYRDARRRVVDICERQNQRAGKQIVDCDLKSVARSGSTETDRLKIGQKLQFFSLIFNNN